jgi:hypothetical protein
VSGKVFWWANEKLINLATIFVFKISDHTLFLVSVIATDPHCFFPLIRHVRMMLIGFRFEFIGWFHSDWLGIAASMHGDKK